jgi:hypothetical protein
MPRFRFRQSFRVLPWLRLNLSKGGLSTSVGKSPLTFNVPIVRWRGDRKRSPNVTVSAPGLGLSYVAEVSDNPLKSFEPKNDVNVYRGEGHLAGVARPDESARGSLTPTQIVGLILAFGVLLAVGHQIYKNRNLAPPPTVLESQPRSGSWPEVPPERSDPLPMQAPLPPPRPRL